MFVRTFALLLLTSGLGCAASASNRGAVGAPATTSEPPAAVAPSLEPAAAPHSAALRGNLQKLEALRSIKEAIDADAVAYIESVQALRGAVADLDAVGQAHEVPTEEVDAMIQAAASGGRVSIAQGIPSEQHAQVQQRLETLREHASVVGLGSASSDAQRLEAQLAVSLKEAQSVWAELEPATVPGQGTSEAEAVALGRQRDAGASLMRTIEARVETAEEAIEDAVVWAGELGARLAGTSTGPTAPERSEPADSRTVEADPDGSSASEGE